MDEIVDSSSLVLVALLSHCHFPRVRAVNLLVLLNPKKGSKRHTYSSRRVGTAVSPPNTSANMIILDFRHARHNNLEDDPFYWVYKPFSLQYLFIYIYIYLNLKVRIKVNQSPPCISMCLHRHRAMKGQHLQNRLEASILMEAFVWPSSARLARMVIKIS